MDLFQISLLAIIQGVAELLPVSSSAHVIVAEKLMGLDPTTPELTLLLVMLHTGTMFAVIVHFWKVWRPAYFGSIQSFRTNALYVAAATVATGLIGLLLLQGIKMVASTGTPGFEIEHLFGNSRLMAIALAAAGILIIASSRFPQSLTGKLSLRGAILIGAVQGLCLPFRGFSRSGATISTGLAMGVARQRAEEFSFALAVVLTPVVIIKESYRLYKSSADIGSLDGHAILAMVGPSLFGMVFSFIAGLLALRWLSHWLEHGRWHFFGCYCLLASLGVLWVG